MAKAQTRASNKYNAKNYDRIPLNVAKGKKDLIKAHAEQFDNGSVNAFINRAIDMTMEADKKESYVSLDDIRKYAKKKNLSDSEIERALKIYRETLETDENGNIKESDFKRAMLDIDEVTILKAMSKNY